MVAFLESPGMDEKHWPVTLGRHTEQQRLQTVWGGTQLTSQTPSRPRQAPGQEGTRALSPPTDLTQPPLRPRALSKKLRGSWPNADPQLSWKTSTSVCPSGAQPLPQLKNPLKAVSSGPSSLFPSLPVSGIM